MSIVGCYVIRFFQVPGGGQFDVPNGITVDSSGNVRVADGDDRIQVFVVTIRRSVLKCDYHNIFYRTLYHYLVPFRRTHLHPGIYFYCHSYLKLFSKLIMRYSVGEMALYTIFFKQQSRGDNKLILQVQR